MQSLQTRTFVSSPLGPKLVTKMFYRAGNGEEKSSDENAIEEVIVKKSYTRVRSHFDVQPGERWLDLGANIGSFAVYCRMRGATAVCYEPDPENFKILHKNAPDFELHMVAVSAMREKSLVFKTSPNPLNHYRGTICEAPARYVDAGVVRNLYGAFLRKQKFDGVKMDIEGAEAGILDQWLLPKWMDKLVLEYHTSRDANIQRLEQRLQLIEAHFAKVKYPKLYDDIIHWAHGNLADNKKPEWPPRFDQLIFAWGHK